MSEAFELLVPAEDSALGDRFAELDQVMQAWLAAMGSAQRVLGAALTGSRPAGEAAAPQILAEPEQPAAEPPVQSAEPAERQPQDQLEPEPAAVPSPAVEPQAVASAPAAASPPKPTGVKVGIRAMMPDASARSPEPKTEKAAAAESDEALLASLDPETAQAVRIMRRMNVAGKSVRQLIEEYQASKTGQAPATAKRSWWKRG